MILLIVRIVMTTMGWGVAITSVALGVRAATGLGWADGLLVGMMGVH